LHYQCGGPSNIPRTIAALTAFGVAGEVAARNADGPGSFAIAIIDALHGLDNASLRAHLRVHNDG